MVLYLEVKIFFHIIGKIKKQKEVCLRVFFWAKTATSKVNKCLGDEVFVAIQVRYRT